MILPTKPSGAGQQSRRTATRTLELYTPHETQLKFHQSRSRYRVAAWGRQSGKSTACLNELLSKAWETPGQKFWFASPTFAQAKIQYRRMVGMLSPCWQVLLKKNQTELRVKLVNQSEIVCVSGEVLNNLRGETIHGVVIDEVRQQHPDLWPLVLRPMLSTTQGWAAFVSTPNGFDPFYDMAERARLDETGVWNYQHAPSTCNPMFTQAEFEAAKADMSEAEFAQEILAEFRDLTQGKTYLCHNQDNLMRTSPFVSDGTILSPHLPILVAMDFNLSPMAWTLGQERAGHFYFFDEIWLKGSHTPEATRELIARVKDHKPGVMIAGDATSKARQRAAAGQSDYAIVCQLLDEAKIPWTNITPSENPAVKDRINAVNAHLRSADGTVRLWYHPEKCPRLKRDFDRVTWKPGAHATLDKNSDLDLTHSSDGVGYAVCALTDLWTPKAGVLRVIQR